MILIFTLLLSFSSFAELDNTFNEHNTAVMQKALEVFKKTKDYTFVSHELSKLKKSSDGLYVYSVLDINNQKVLIGVEGKLLKQYFKSYPAFKKELVESCNSSSLSEQVACLKEQRAQNWELVQTLNPKVKYTYRTGEFQSSITGFNHDYKARGDNFLAQIYVEELDSLILELEQKAKIERVASNQIAKQKADKAAVEARQKRKDELALQEKRLQDEAQVSIDYAKKRQAEDRAKAEADRISGNTEKYLICKYSLAQQILEQQLKDEETLAKKMGYGDLTAVNKLKQDKLNIAREIMRNENSFKNNTGKDFDHSVCKNSP